tara:strand:+ start:399 stop:938 length:540 start_codon:yes stop_codon:yes gene_type:complete
MKLENHLGGHCNVTHIDINAIQLLKDKYNIKTMYDLGCGPGGMVIAAQHAGINCVGIDGDYTLKYPIGVNVILHDFTKGKPDVEPRDACWSCEFLEHVEEKYLDNIFEVFKKCSVVFCTASMAPGGHHHVNLKDCDYWISQFTNRGFTYNKDMTAQLRSKSSMHRDFVRDTGMVFEYTI